MTSEIKSRIIKEFMISPDYYSIRGVRCSRLKLIKDFVNRLRLHRKYIGNFTFSKFPVMFKNINIRGDIKDVIMCEIIFT